jgi:exodeoxyribonuclease VII large subunit
MRAIHPVAPQVVFTVSRLASYIKKKLRDDPALRRIGVRGEITGLKQVNGTLYFDLKDNSALINCVVWSRDVPALPLLANGQEIVAVGSVQTYEKRSAYQLFVDAVEPAGLGRLQALYEALKVRLQAEGLFDAARRRPLPRFPFRVALVSSRNTNGAGDFITKAAQRAPYVEIVRFDTPVQGANAAPEIVRALGLASRAAVDVIVLARGGGSYEDLFVFSDERVVRALARCAHPTVSAIGHEADTPLTDFVADQRQPTPSAAAEILAPRDGLRKLLAERTRKLDRSIKRTLEKTKLELSSMEVRSPLWAPRDVLQSQRQTVDTLGAELQHAERECLRVRSDALGAVIARLEKCSPGVRLGRRRESLMVAKHRLDVRVSELIAGQRRRLGDASIVRSSLWTPQLVLRDFRRSLELTAGSLRRATETAFDVRAGRLKTLAARLEKCNPSVRLSRRREHLALVTYRLGVCASGAAARNRRELGAAEAGLAAAAQAGLERRRTILRLREAELDGRDPTRILGRGYAIVTVGGMAVRDVASVAPGTLITARLARGSLAARVETTSDDGGE